jgi:hypothetical protein
MPYPFVFMGLVFEHKYYFDFCHIEHCEPRSFTVTAVITLNPRKTNTNLSQYKIHKTFLFVYLFSNYGAGMTHRSSLIVNRLVVIIY